MSHIGQYASKLDGVSRMVLDEAIARVAKTEKVKVHEDITEYGGRRVTTHEGLAVIGAIRTVDLPQGVGIAIDGTGTLRFLCDTLNERGAREFDRIKIAIESQYTVAAIEIALVENGYTIDRVASGPQPGMDTTRILASRDAVARHG